MFFAGDLEGFFKPGFWPGGGGLSRGVVEEIAEQENDGLMPGATVEETDGFGQVGALAFWFYCQQLPDDVESVFPAFFGRDVTFDPIAKKDDAYFVVVVDGGESQHGAYL